MAAKQVNPTRMELTRLKKKRITAIRGHKLLKDKRDELMRQYLDLVRENMEVRLRVEEGILSANRNFVIARAGMSEAALNTALMAPKQEVGLIVDEKNVMSVEIPTFTSKTRTADENDIYSYGFAFTSSDLDGAVKSLSDILPDMIRLAECEKACQLMAAEIEKILMTAAVFILLQKVRIHNTLIAKKLSKISKYGFGIYIVHYFVVGPIFILIGKFDLPIPLQVPIMALLIFIISWAFTWFMYRILGERAKWIMG